MRRRRRACARCIIALPLRPANVDFCRRENRNHEALRATPAIRDSRGPCPTGRPRRSPLRSRPCHSSFTTSASPTTARPSTSWPTCRPTSPSAGPGSSAPTASARAPCSSSPSACFEPTDGAVQDGRAALYCAQRTDDAPAHLQELALDYSAEASVLRQRLGIGDGWAGRWHSLSHGERKRCQIATALWQRPDVLAIDEPTNHLDEEARSRVEAALRGFAGVGHPRKPRSRPARRAVPPVPVPRDRGGDPSSGRLLDGEPAGGAAERDRPPRPPAGLHRAQTAAARPDRTAHSGGPGRGQTLGQGPRASRQRRPRPSPGGDRQWQGRAGRPSALPAREAGCNAPAGKVAAIPVHKDERSGIWLSAARSSRSNDRRPAGRRSGGGRERAARPPAASRWDPATGSR